MGELVHAFEERRRGGVMSEGRGQEDVHLRAPDPHLLEDPPMLTWEFPPHITPGPKDIQPLWGSLSTWSSALKSMTMDRGSGSSAPAPGHHRVCK